MKHTKKYRIAVAVHIALLSGCAQLVQPSSEIEGAVVQLDKSYLEESVRKSSSGEVNAVDSTSDDAEFLRLNRLSDNKDSLKFEVDLAENFKNEGEFQVSLNELPLNEFLHYIFGELLQVSYLLDSEVKSNVTPITLELKEPVSEKRLFKLAQEILNRNNVNIVLNDNIYFVHNLAKAGGKDNIAFGFGRTLSDVPNVSGEIIQMVPLNYGTSGGLRQIISSLVNAKVRLDAQQSMAVIEGRRESISRALSLLNLLDSPKTKNKAMALLSFRYIDSETFIEKVTELLLNEGINATRTVANSANVQFVPIEHLGQVIVFANADEIIDRVEYWSSQLDKPAKGSKQSFYTYHPKFARATDLGESLAPLIASSASSSTSSRTSSENNNAVTRPQQQTGTSATTTIVGDGMRLVVDQRSNSLIFYATGKRYQELQPIIKKLDVMPKQVMLEVVIAEVTLTGSFSKGVEFALKNGPSGNRSESFSFENEAGFGYSVVGLDGEINLNLNQTDGLVNVLSRPTLLVRDGVSASISVGNDIPTVGSTTSDPDGDRQTTSIQYRSTGIELSVTPTVNAQGTVIMSIDQNISNVPTNGASLNGSPSIFERKVTTEVVAGDGQTVMLGGLISEDNSTNASAVPVLGDIPILGHLFRTDSESKSKTELVILVTPKIVTNVNDWTRVQDSFLKGLENIKF